MESMPELAFSWNKRFAIVRVLYSFLFWGVVFLLPGLMLWMASLDKPGKYTDAIVGLLGVFGLIWTVHSRRYWFRLFDRSPQVEFFPGFIRARQWGDVDVLWKSIVNIRGRTQAIGTDVIDAAVFLEVTGRGEIELDTTGLDRPTEDIFEAAVALWNRQRFA
jgi:hypothetical protein